MKQLFLIRLERKKEIYNEFLIYLSSFFCLPLADNCSITVLPCWNKYIKLRIKRVFFYFILESSLPMAHSLAAVLLCCCRTELLMILSLSLCCMLYIHNIFFRSVAGVSTGFFPKPTAEITRQPTLDYIVHQTEIICIGMLLLLNHLVNSFFFQMANKYWG